MGKWVPPCLLLISARSQWFLGQNLSHKVMWFNDRNKITPIAQTKEKRTMKPSKMAGFGKGKVPHFACRDTFFFFFFFGSFLLLPCFLPASCLLACLLPSSDDPLINVPACWRVCLEKVTIGWTTTLSLFQVSEHRGCHLFAEGHDVVLLD